MDNKIFEDQTEETRIKADRRNGRFARSMERPLVIKESQSNLRQLETGSLPSIQLTQSVDECALNYFYVNFIAPTSLHEFPTKDKLGDADTAMGAAIQCAALASFAHRLGSGSDVQYARNRYAQALLLANEALRKPKNANTSDTLVAIHFLSMFEVSERFRPVHLLQSVGCYKTSFKNHFAFL